SLGARSGVMRAAAAGARAEEGTVRREVTTAMAVAYYRLGYTVTALETLRHQRELLEAAVQLSTTRYATGAAPQSDPLQAKLARDRLRSEELALESERVAALAAVNALRNRAPGDTVTVTPIDPAAVRAGVWAGRKQNRLADAARADSTGAAAGLQDAELQLSREVTETAARVQASQQRLALLVDGVLPTAQGTVESVMRSYQVGRAEFLTLLSVADAHSRAPP